MSPTGFPSYPTPLRCFPDGEPVHSCGIKRVGGRAPVGEGVPPAARCGAAVRLISGTPASRGDANAHGMAGTAAPAPGYAVRFPRYKRQRDDKTPETATGSDEVVAMFKQ